MSDYNSIPPYVRSKTQDNTESLGITQQPAGDEVSWYQFIGGLIIQGGMLEAETDLTTTVTFPMPFPKKTLGVFCQVVGAENGVASVLRVILGTVALTGFNVELGTEQSITENVEGYWWAVGY